MIVMKFGGSSLGSAASVKQVLGIIQSERHLCPVIVASAMGDTTDMLMDLANEARKGHTYGALKLQDAIKEQHFPVCDALLQGTPRESAEAFLRRVFRDLHVRILELCEGDVVFTPELQDSVTSLGEQLSSRLVAEALSQHVGSTLHLDATKLILTDNNFTDAKPRYWETYARLRWSVPVAARKQLVVLGGFIGSTEDGRTTTLGRGGSDLTASIVGAAINADEIQVWKDVDGMLTCDPRVLPGGHQVSRLSYQEATELARAGATILHPQTMEPARRLRIPITIRNTFRPDRSGTRIEQRAAAAPGTVKSIAIQRRCTVLEVRPVTPDASCASFVEFCKEINTAASILSSSEEAMYLAIKDGAVIPEDRLSTSPCLQVHLRSEQAIVTLVGESLNKAALGKRITVALQDVPVLLIPDEASSSALRLSVPEQQLKRSLDLLHRLLFSHPDGDLFVPASANAERETVPDNPVRQTAQPKSFLPSMTLVQAN